MRYKARRDINESDIVAYLRRIGATVYQIDQTGFPDLAVGYRGINLLLEVKSPSGNLTPPQQDFFSSWSGSAFVVRGVGDTKDIIRNIMVTRVYACPKCGVFILKQRISENPTKSCPACTSEIKQVYTPPTIAFLGDGWGGKSDEPRPKS